MADGSFDIRSILQQIKKAFLSLTTIQKSMVVAITLVLFIFLAGLSVWASREPMGVLMSELNPIDANAVIESLKKQSVKYELSSDQRTIYVPAKQVSQLRLSIAGEEILSGEKVGFEKLESPGLTTTEFTQKTTYKLAQEKHLAKTLREGLPHIIKDAKVIITPAKDSVFVSEKEEAKASVLLRLVSNRTLPEENVQAITNLVSHSVEGLKPENVVISDHNARILNKRDTQVKITDTQRKMQREEEYYLVEKVTEQLEPAVGRGKVMASAKVELDFDKVQITEQTFDPQGQVERSVQTEEEKSTKRQPPLGIPGTPTNVAPADAEAFGANIFETMDKKKSTTNFEISNTVRAVDKSPGSIRRISISVLLDEKITWERNSRGHYEQKPLPWTPAELEKFRNLVAGATGIDNSRGDIVTVDSISFAATADPREEEAATRQYWIDLAKILAPFAIILIGFIGWLIYKFITREKEVPEEEPTLLEVVEEEAEAKAAAVVAEGEEMAEAPPPPKTLAELRAEIEQEINADTASQAPEAQRREVIKQRVTEVISADPENAASLVRSWLADDDGGSK